MITLHPSPPPPPSHPHDNLTPYFSEIDYKITNKERLNTKASPGPDNISGSFLPSGNPIVIPSLNIFFNMLFSMATQPCSFSLNFLKSTFKKEEPTDPSNYRGIAIGSAIAKLFNLIILAMLENRILSDKPLSPKPNRFQKRT